MREDQREYEEIVGLVWPDWEIIEPIGSGAFATVVRAARRNRIAGEKDSAIKIIRIPNSDSDWELMLAEGKTEAQAERYFQDVVDDSLREIRAMEDLTGNTNIVNIFDYKVHRVPDRHVWYILIRMEYLQKVETRGFGEREIIRLGTDVCTALSICRTKNIVHRDVSLDNIFIHDGNYKLGDFGVAKVLEGTIGSMHSIAGKPLYMAPEVYNATLVDTDIDSAAKVDIYSLGILLYRLCNNMKYPFENPDEENTTAKERNQAFKRRVIEGEALPAPKNASPELAAVILKACMANPGKRYESAAAMREDLLALARTPEKHGSPWKKVLVALAVCAVLAAGYLFFLRPVLFSGWGEWSEWTENAQAVTDPERMQVETKGAYRWKAVRCPVCGENNPQSRQTCANTACGAELPADPDWLYAYSDDTTGQMIYGELGRYFGGIPYWFDGGTTQYRYRTRDREKKNAAEDVCSSWYFTSYENSETYPGIVFAADGADQYFKVYTDGENLIAVDHTGLRESTREASYEDGVLNIGSAKYTLEDGRMVRRYGTVTEVYTREPQENRIPADVSKTYANYLKPEHYDGTWIITQYGMNNAYADAETMDLTGKAVIKDRKITVAWTRNGQEKSFEMIFDEELNNGRLYALVNDAVSYIVSMRRDNTILLNVGLNQAQWVMKKENVIDEETVHPEVPGFEEAFAAKADWTATEEGRNRLAELLLQAAVAGGVDPATIRTDGAFVLALLEKQAEKPMLVCEGCGEYEYCMLTVGRGVSIRTGEPFVYFHWSDEFFTVIQHPDQPTTWYEQEEILPIVAGDQIWKVSPGF